MRISNYIVGFPYVPMIFIRVLAPLSSSIEELEIELTYSVHG